MRTGRRGRLCQEMVISVVMLSVVAEASGAEICLQGSRHLCQEPDAVVVVMAKASDAEI